MKSGIIGQAKKETGRENTDIAERLRARNKEGRRCGDAEAAQEETSREGDGQGELASE